MSIEITDRTTQILNSKTIQPHIVLVIDGVDTVFSSATIEEIIRIGDPGLEIGGDWVIGGFRDNEDQSELISLGGTTTEINQQLMPDRGAVSSISSMKISLVDKSEEITRLISPGEVVTDILARRARVYLGFEGTSYPEDYITIFRGLIDDVESEQGLVSINIAHPDQKKRNTIFEKAQTALDGNIDDLVTTIPAADTSDFLVGITGPDAAVDTSFTAYIKIDDEIIKYTGKTSNSFTGCSRGQFGTLSDAHDDDAEINSFYRLTGNGVDLALKILLSGWAGPFQEDVVVTNFVRTTGSTDIANSIFFENVDLKDQYGVCEGDYITTTGDANGANNVSLKQIETMEVVDGSTYIVITGVTFVSSINSAAVIAFRSQYDTLPSGIKMHGDEVDVDQHRLWYNKFLSSFDYDFYLKDTLEGKEFIEKQIYLPMSAYALPRKSRSSMGFHTGPLPTDVLTTIDDTNCTNANNLKVRRSLGKNFYNTVIYKFEMDVLEDKYLFGFFATNTDSKTRMNNGNKSLIIQADGMRRNLGGQASATSSANRFLNRYKFAAEYIDDLKVKFSVGFKVEVGDIIILDGTNLNLVDTVTASRGSEPRLFEIINKKLNIKTGEVRLSLVDTNIDITQRYALISPASYIASGTSTTVFTIEESFASVYGVNEWRKWKRYIGCGVKVRNDDFSTQDTSTIVDVVGNVITVSPALSFTPSAGQIMELSEYNNQTDMIKLFYTFMTDEAAFDDGAQPYTMI